MSELPPAYSDAAQPSDNSAYPPHSYAPQPDVPYPPPQEQQPYPPPQQLPYPTQQQPYPPTEKQPYPTTEKQPYPPTEKQPYPTTQQPHAQYPPAVPPPPNPTQVVTVHTTQDYNWTSNYIVGIVILSACSIFCCFPIGVSALVLSIVAFYLFDSKEYIRANIMARISICLASTAISIGTFIFIIALLSVLV